MSTAPSSSETEQVPGRRELRVFLVFLAVTAVSILLPIPYAYVALASGPVALLFGIAALIRSRGAQNLKVLRVSVSVGLAMIVFSMLSALGMVFFREPVEGLRDCMSRATTNTAKAACEREYEESYQQVLEDYGVELP
jgi:hypothetical protein